MDLKLPIKADLVDNAGKPLTQSLFLELTYNEKAVYSLKEDHCEWEGKIYPSLKRLYLEIEDPTEYEFATKYLLGYKHWKRICENKQLIRHVEEWREELEMKLRSKAVKNMLLSAQEGNYQAAKWFADRGWSNKGAGRPTKADVEREKKFQARVDSEFSADVFRLFNTEKVQ
ncbi:MAG TPA: hypothetical protein VFM18_21740 [Methanosarcina sp.]|nr:hypothetical protein [Methanosarcina sp.]